jgi:hypothetical protein
MINYGNYFGIFSFQSQQEYPLNYRSVAGTAGRLEKQKNRLPNPIEPVRYLTGWLNIHNGH